MTDKQKEQYGRYNAKLKAKGERPLTPAEYFRVTGKVSYAWKNVRNAPATGRKGAQP